MRAYAAMALGSAERGDLAVHSALVQILQLHLGDAPDPVSLFALVDRQVVAVSRRQIPFFPKQNPLGGLTPLQRRAVLLRTTHGFSEAEIGEILDLQLSEVKALLDASACKLAGRGPDVRLLRPVRRQG
ncbi:MAG: sigma factor-like helix-turn-helix DNA-binding protein [Hyphomonas sp.]|uniref:sigma factor-like helix-turn-helix DNA-binding protein n=1 Tax=Hyphomonas sp. TaxID=87 RepID=UPI003527CB49